MNHVARVLAVVTGVAALVGAVAALVRELALASDEAVSWQTPSWWADLTRGDGPAAVAAAVAAGLTVLFFVLAARLDAGMGEEVVSRVEAGEGTAVSVAALQRLVTRRLREAVPGVEPVVVRLRRADEGWRLRVVADLPPEDLAGLQAAAARVADAELRQAAGVGLSALELEVRRFARSAR